MAAMSTVVESWVRIVAPRWFWGRPSMRAFSLLAFVVVASPAAAANLVVNPGFEANLAPNGGYIQYFGGNSFTGWNVVGSQLIVIDHDYVENGFQTNAHSGQNSLDLTGLGAGTSTTGINQDLSTVIGRTYTLSFWVGNLHSNGGAAAFTNDPTTVDVSINGGTRTAFTHGGVTQNLVNYKQFATNFVATASTTNLAFFRGASVDYHVALDDVSVTAIPEPMTWSLMIVGFGLVGAAMRRQRIGTPAR